jgi:hypothetical protein
MSPELGDGDLRPYLPGAVMKILKSICVFEDLPLRLDPTMIERIAHIYFTHAPERMADDSVPSVSANTIVGGEPPASMFSAGKSEIAAAAGGGGGGGSARDWTSVAAKAVSELTSDDADDRSTR